MGNRTIKAPGVEIIEHDLSSYTTTNLGTNCLITGFAQKGEDLEPIQITNKSSWLLNFGAPTNEAEEYFYTAAMEVLDQGGFLYASKIPYSNDIAGIYAAAKYKINDNRELYNFDKSTGVFYTTDENGEREDQTIEPISSDGKFNLRYQSMKDLGLNSLSLIAPEGQDFLSKDLVDEYETGESEPGSNVIYLVDKTRAVYTRATEIADKQTNRDARACIGIVPVITTMCNTAYFQSASTGVESDVDELYQPVRSLKTIEFPAGAASAAEYKPTKFTSTDLHTQLLQTSDHDSSLSKTAAMLAQSCLVNGNLVDGQLKPFVANEVAVIVFKAFVSTEDGKIDFTPVETWTGSLDPDGRDEKGRTTFIDTIINNNSEYIYCFSNLENPQEVLMADHGFVAGSDSEYTTVKADLADDVDYQAATLFSAYVANLLGFNTTETVPNYSLAAPRDFNLEVDEDADDSIADETGSMKALRAFYNQDAKEPVCVVDELKYGATLDIDKLVDISGDDTIKAALTTALASENGYMNITDKYLTTLPEITYTIDKDSGTSGSIDFDITDADDVDEDDLYTVDAYKYTLTFVNSDGSTTINKTSDETLPDIGTMDLSELSIFNSTDYLRAITDFEDLVDDETLKEETGREYDSYDDVQGALARCEAIQSLIVNSIEKSARFKSKLRLLKKAKINLDRLDDAYLTYINNDGSSDNAKKSELKVAKKYLEDIFKAYSDTGLLGGITFVDSEETTESGNESRTGTDLLSKKDALEAKLEAIINTDTTKEEKMSPRLTNANDATENLTLAMKYIRTRIYLNSIYNLKMNDMLTFIGDIIDDCAYAQQRYVESQRNIDDSNIMLGFYPEMAEPIITYTTIAQSLDKILDTMGNIDTVDVDVVCDAGISNIAQFVKQVYDPSADDGEDVGGLYEPVKYTSYFKFNKNTDLAYWKTIVMKYNTFCKYRGDCMFCTESPRGMVLIGNKQVVRKTKKDTSVDLNILPYLSKITGFNTSYGAGYLNWYRTISDYTGDTLWVPPSIKAMGTYILTDKSYNWWDAPAGLRRGVLNMVDTAFNPNKTQAGEIYDANWNYAINYVNDGVIQEGQKTFQTRQSALDRVNVRRLLGRIKRYVYTASRQFLYEPHTQSLREQYVKTMKPWFDDLVNRGGLYDYKIICDSTNNTAEVIDRNELRVKIGIKPVKTVEFIICDLCVLNTGAVWTEMDSI